MLEVFLVELKASKLVHVGNIDRDIGGVNGRAKDSDILTYCNKWKNQLVQGRYLFIAESVDGSLIATQRATYSEWDKEEPFYIDSAEWDERVMFADVVSSYGILSHI